MGHIDGKGLCKRLTDKIDNLTVRAPRDEKLYSILKELYSTEEADLVVRMPCGMSGIDRLAVVTGYEGAKLSRLLEGLCRKGLVIDIFEPGSIIMPHAYGNRDVRVLFDENGT